MSHGWINAAAAGTIRIGGYYTISVRQGFRVIVLNNNDCYVYNWWVLYSRNDIRGQLQWLHDTLLAAERAHERVHILQHIRSGGGSCFKWWQREYRRVVDRFENILNSKWLILLIKEIFQIPPDHRRPIQRTFTSRRVWSFLRQPRIATRCECCMERWLIHRLQQRQPQLRHLLCWANSLRECFASKFVRYFFNDFSIYSKSPTWNLTSSAFPKPTEHPHSLHAGSDNSPSEKLLEFLICRRRVWIVSPSTCQGTEICCDATGSSRWRLPIHTCRTDAMTTACAAMSAPLSRTSTPSRVDAIKFWLFSELSHKTLMVNIKMLKMK